MTKTTQNNLDSLLEELKTANLEDHSNYLANEYFISEDGNDDIWKYKKKFHGVVTDFVTRYELWNGRLIARVYFVWQGWLDKKKQKRIVEVQRYLGGCRNKLSRYVYQGNYGIKCLINYMFYTESRFQEESKWNVTKHTTLDILGECYRGSYYYGTYIENEEYAKHVVSKECEESKHRYCAFSYSKWQEYRIFEWLELYEKHPQIEMFAKLNLTWALTTGMNYFRWSKKGLAILGLESKNELKYLQACGSIAYYRECKEDIFKYNLDTYDKFIGYLRMSRNNMEINKKSLKYMMDNNFNIYFYLDYLRFVEKLGLPKTSKILYPQNLRESHEKLEKKIQVIDSMEKQEQIKNRVIKELYKYRFGDNEFIITPANSPLDLINESKELSHCVRTYIDKYAAGDTSIFLIRKRENVNHPYYTLELRRNEVIQLRGKNNCRPTDSVVAFVNKWAKKNKLSGAYIN